MNLGQSVCQEYQGNQEKREALVQWEIGGLQASQDFKDPEVTCLNILYFQGRHG